VVFGEERSQFLGVSIGADRPVGESRDRRGVGQEFVAPVAGEIRNGTELRRSRSKKGRTSAFESVIRPERRAV
jgi:hypothetical protein